MRGYDTCLLKALPVEESEKVIVTTADSTISGIRHTNNILKISDEMGMKLYRRPTNKIVLK